jgi:formylglycine-generating enzyme required for sulfatase activity/DNA-binding SARP family transcriptional activator
VTDLSPDATQDGPNLRLFGAPALLDPAGGASLPLDRKPLALLAYLYVSGSQASRATLAELFWPGSAPAQSATNLRKAIWGITKVAGEGAIRVDPASNSLAAGGLRSDVVAFTSASRGCADHREYVEPAAGCIACLDRWQKASRLYRGELLAGFGLPDCPGFDDWQILHAERLRCLAIDLQARLVQAFLGQQDYDAAIDAAHSWLRIDPLDEAAHRELMRLFAWTGRQAAAIGQFELYAESLRRELGLSPDEQSLALRDAIREHRLMPPLTARQARARIASQPQISEAVDLQSRIRIRQAAASADQAPSLYVATGSELSGRHQADAGRLMRSVMDGRTVATFDPEELQALAAQTAIDLSSFAISRIAEWSQPRYQLDRRFVQLGLLVDRGEAATEGRWRVEPRHFDELKQLMIEVEDPALVLLGRPGAGKSTLLRRLELDLAVARLRGESVPLTVLVSLNAYRAAAGGARPDPLSWIAERWQLRHPRLPGLSQLMAEQPLLFLLDGLNEIPHEGPEDYVEAVAEWQRFLAERVAPAPGLRALFSCRSLDYSAPLSSPGLRVPMIRLEGLSDAGMRAFIEEQLPQRAEAFWSELLAGPGLEPFRTPYFLRLLVEQAQAGASRLPDDLPALFTSILRQSLRRELEQGGRSIAPQLLGRRDRLRILQADGWPDPYHLQDEAGLATGLGRLAYRMQAQTRSAEMGQVRFGWAEARRVCTEVGGEDLIRAGLALGLLEDDLGSDELLFTHQLWQEYFAARLLAAAPEPALVESEWRRARIEPGLEHVLAEMAPGDRLPSLPRSRWAETMLLAAPMGADPAAFLQGLMASDLALAGHAARRLLDAHRIDPAAALLADLRSQLLGRSRDLAADPRARIAAGLALGLLGDPRFPLRQGPDGVAYRIGPLASIPAGRYPLGEDAPLSYLGRPLDHHQPRHTIALAAFELGVYPVTHAEFACFIDAGGYEDTRWWQGRAASAWQRGEGTAEGHRAAVRYWWRRFREKPEIMEIQHESGDWDEATYQRWRAQTAMEAEALDGHLRKLHPDGVLRRPMFWEDGDFNNPNQPVVGVSWFEARAYCAWLSAQSQRRLRLPSEAEWEAGARGLSDAERAYAGGEGFDLELGNTGALRLRRTTPVGVFPSGDSPLGIADLCGNVWDWTTSAWGPEMMQPAYRYPYDPEDGRESENPAPNVRRVVRGGCWTSGRISCRLAYRGRDHACDRSNLHGFRILVESDS